MTLDQLAQDSTMVVYPVSEWVAYPLVESPASAVEVGDSPQLAGFASEQEHNASF
jgi:hypothetical protein